MKKALAMIEIALISALICVISITCYTMFNNLKLNLLAMTKVSSTGVIGVTSHVGLTTSSDNISTPAVSSQSNSTQNSNEKENTLNTNSSISTTNTKPNTLNTPINSPSTESDIAIETTGSLAHNTSTSSSSNSGSAVETVGAAASEDTSNTVIDKIINLGNAVAGAFNNALNSVIKGFGG